MSLSLRFVICLCGCSESTLNIIYNTWCSRWRKYGLIIYKIYGVAVLAACQVSTSIARKWSTVPFLALQRHSSAGNQGSFWGVSTVKLKGELTPFAKHEILNACHDSYPTYCLRLQCWRSADSFQPSSTSGVSCTPSSMDVYPSWTAAALMSVWWTHAAPRFSDTASQPAPRNVPPRNTGRPYLVSLDKAQLKPLFPGGYTLRGRKGVGWTSPYFSLQWCFLRVFFHYWVRFWLVLLQGVLLDGLELDANWTFRVSFVSWIFQLPFFPRFPVRWCCNTIAALRIRCIQMPWDLWTWWNLWGLRGFPKQNVNDDGWLLLVGGCILLMECCVNCYGLQCAVYIHAAINYLQQLTQWYIIVYV